MNRRLIIEEACPTCGHYDPHPVEHEWYGPLRREATDRDYLIRQVETKLQNWPGLLVEVNEDYKHLAIDLVNLVIDGLLQSAQETAPTGYEWIKWPTDKTALDAIRDGDDYIEWEGEYYTTDEWARYVEARYRETGQ